VAGPEAVVALARTAQVVPAQTVATPTLAGQGPTVLPDPTLRRIPAAVAVAVVAAGRAALPVEPVELVGMAGRATSSSGRFADVDKH
jgi:hypothetical protein